MTRIKLLAQEKVNYAAAATIISCRFALAKSSRSVVKIMVLTMRTTMHIESVVFLLKISAK